MRDGFGILSMQIETKAPYAGAFQDKDESQLKKGVKLTSESSKLDRKKITSSRGLQDEALIQVKKREQN